MTAGAICLSHKGCGFFIWLVVTGPESGTLWTDLRAADGTLEPLSAGPRRVDFSSWYLDWLSRAAGQAHSA
jgi:hypothetical protein